MEESQNMLQRLALRVSDWAEKWFPDSYVFAGFFIPSGGGKWIIEAPYVLKAANELQVHLGWAVQVYNAAEALPNLINPFFMLPMLGILKLKPKDVMGFTVTQLVFHIPLVLFLLWILGKTLTYMPPVMP